MDIIKNYMTFNMMKSSILIIANGPSTLDNQFGDIIDTFDNVARINNYKTSNFENCIGSKTTIWFNGANKKLTPRPKFEGKIVFNRSKPDGTKRKLLDSSRIRSLGWNPKINLEKGIRLTLKTINRYI